MYREMKHARRGHILVLRQTSPGAPKNRLLNVMTRKFTAKTFVKSNKSDH